MPLTCSDVTMQLRVMSRRDLSVQRCATFMSTLLTGQTVMFIDLQEFTRTCATVGFQQLFQKLHNTACPQFRHVCTGQRLTRPGG